MAKDLKEWIDFSYLNEILKKNKGKKVICFGGGTAADVLAKERSLSFEIAYFLDNKQNLWGTDVNGIEVKNPSELKKEEKGSFIVFIISSHMNAISQQLDSFGLRDEVDYYNVYRCYIPYFTVGKFVNNAELFLQMLENLSDTTFHHVKPRPDHHIGVVCHTTMSGGATSYSILLYLLLKYYGYRVTLIVDSIRSFDDAFLLEGQSIIVKEYVDQAIGILKAKFPDLDIRYVDDKQTVDLDEADRKEIDRLVALNYRWHSMVLERRGKICSKEDFYKTANELLENELKAVKCFFQKNHFDSINVLTGIHKQRGPYTWIGKRNGMRVSSYNGGSGNLNAYSFLSSNGPAPQQFDVAKTIRENWFDESSKKSALKYAEDIFNKRIRLCAEDGILDGQVVRANHPRMNGYDIVIPLNYTWDAACLGLDDLFEDMLHWLTETIDFIIKNTNAIIMVKEHPVTGRLKDLKPENFQEIVKTVYDGDRLLFVPFDGKVNLYESIRNCKLVLPYTTTAGIEAALIGKPTLVCTNCYYSDFKFVLKTKTKPEYFQMIQNYLRDGTEYQLSAQAREEALLAFILVVNGYVKTNVHEHRDEWRHMEFKDVVDMEGVEKIMRIIGDGVPAHYLNTLEMIHKKDKEKSC